MRVELIGAVGFEPTTNEFRFVDIYILPGLYHHPSLRVRMSGANVVIKRVKPLH